MILNIFEYLDWILERIVDLWYIGEIVGCIFLLDFIITQNYRTQHIFDKILVRYHQLELFSYIFLPFFVCYLIMLFLYGKSSYVGGWKLYLHKKNRCNLVHCQTHTYFEKQNNPLWQIFVQKYDFFVQHLHLVMNTWYVICDHI